MAAESATVALEFTTRTVSRNSPGAPREPLRPNARKPPRFGARPPRFGATTSAGAPHFYVANSGDDASGLGTRKSPWRTVQHTLASIDYSQVFDWQDAERRGRAPAMPRVRLMPGLYLETLEISSPITLIGAPEDPALVTIEYPGDPGSVQGRAEYAVRILASAGQRPAGLSLQVPDDSLGVRLVGVTVTSGGFNGGWGGAGGLLVESCQVWLERCAFLWLAWGVHLDQCRAHVSDCMFSTYGRVEHGADFEYVEMRLEEPAHTGITLSDCDFATIRRSLFLSNIDHPILTRAGCGQVLVDECIVIGSSGHSYHGVWDAGDGAARLAIRHCVFLRPRRRPFSTGDREPETRYPIGYDARGAVDRRELMSSYFAGHPGGPREDSRGPGAAMSLSTSPATCQRRGGKEVWVDDCVLAGFSTGIVARELCTGAIVSVPRTAMYDNELSCVWMERTGGFDGGAADPRVAVFDFSRSTMVFSGGEIGLPREPLRFERGNYFGSDGLRTFIALGANIVSAPLVANAWSVPVGVDTEWWLRTRIVDARDTRDSQTCVKTRPNPSVFG